MLNPFPDLLVFGFFAPTILRIAAAAAFAYVAYAQYQKRDAMAKIPFPIVGNSFGMGAVYVAVVVEGAIAAMLFFGYYTQIAAIVGLVASAKFLYFGKQWPTFAPLSRDASLLLAVILFTLLISGAGALAHDLPL